MSIQAFYCRTDENFQKMLLAAYYCRDYRFVSQAHDLVEPVPEYGVVVSGSCGRTFLQNSENSLRQCQH
ncbi:hypothetical protein AB6G46_24340 [Providencia hangzhouensis]|uniref:hypothetical protein n=1 Tax=Providencia hangzhouensis TaxID=3031799 RepID=UPI0034DCED52